MGVVVRAVRDIQIGGEEDGAVLGACDVPNNTLPSSRVLASVLSSMYEGIRVKRKSYPPQNGPCSKASISILVTIPKLFPPLMNRSGFELALALTMMLDARTTS